METSWAEYQILLVSMAMGMFLPLVLGLRRGVSRIKSIRDQDTREMGRLRMGSRYFHVICLIQLFVGLVILALPCIAVLGLKEPSESLFALLGIGITLSATGVALVYSVRRGNLAWNWPTEKAANLAKLDWNTRE